MTTTELAADKTHRADYQDYDGHWYPILRDVSLANAIKAARKFRDQNPEMETRVR